MLPLKHRLKKREDIKNVFRNGRSFKENFLLLKMAANRLVDSRFAFVVSSSVSKKAVFRNRVRRVMAEIIRLNLAQIEKGFDIVLVVSPGIKQKNSQEISAALTNILLRVKIINAWKNHTKNNSILSICYFALFGAKLPFLAQLFLLCPSVGWKIRPFKGFSQKL